MTDEQIKELQNSPVYLAGLIMGEGGDKELAMKLLKTHSEGTKEVAPTLSMAQTKQDRLDAIKTKFNLEK